MQKGYINPKVDYSAQKGFNAHKKSVQTLAKSQLSLKPAGASTELVMDKPILKRQIL